MQKVFPRAVVANDAFPDAERLKNVAPGASPGGTVGTRGQTPRPPLCLCVFKAVHAGTGDVAILSGVGGWSGAIVAGDLDPHDATAALGFPNAVADLPDQARESTNGYAKSDYRRV